MKLSKLEKRIKKALAAKFPLAKFPKLKETIPDIQFNGIEYYLQKPVIKDKKDGQSQ